MNVKTIGLGVLLVAFGLIYQRVSQDIATNQPPPRLTGHSDIAPDSDSLYCTVSPGTVYDGDTARFICDGEEIKVRFCGIDAPEAKQPGGVESRDYLRSLLPDNAPVVIVPVEEDRYGRLVAEVWNDAITETDQNINAAMVLARHAWHYEQYSGNCPNRSAIATAEEIAGPMEGMPPWEWRRQN